MAAARALGRKAVLTGVLLAALAALFPATLLGQGATQGGPLPGPLPLFPADNWWNVDVTSAPVDLGSAGFLSFIGVSRGLHPDFGGNGVVFPQIYGMVYVTVPGTQPLVPVVFDYWDQSDPGAPGRPPGYPIPDEAKTQTKWFEGGYAGNSGAGGDKHMLIVDRDHRLLFETWDTRCVPAGAPGCSWQAGSGAVFPLDSNLRRTDTWTSADAAGLAILPGLVRWDEAYGADPIRHAFRFTVRDTNGYVFPASHEAGSRSGAPPMGTRLRLKASKTVSSPDAGVQRIVQAMRTYGLIVADNGSDMYIQGTYDTRWDNGILNPAFGSLVAGDFEVIQLGWKPATASGLGFRTLAPCRVLDTRNASGADAAWPALAAQGTRTFILAGRCSIPASAKALSVNIAAVSAQVPGSLVVYPGDETAPLASLLNFPPVGARSNNAIVKLAPDGSVGVLNRANGTVHFILDVNGWFE
jgi:hypothetical protein